ncbi:MAG: hypothetical protein KKH72_14035 [Alphaproteobacteria bacterium]|nr:hypothetical protein [Alphaproteobacteria bacterium]
MSAKSVALRFVGLAGIALIAACAPELEGRLYMQDVAEVAASGQTLVVPASLRIPESTAEECAKGLADLALKLGEITPISGEGECVELNNSQFSQFTVDLPLVTETGELAGAYLAVLTVTPITDDLGPGLALSLRMNRSLEDVQDAIGRGENSGFSISPDDKEQPRFIFAFENDSRDPVTLTPNFVFVNDAPGLPGVGDPIVLDRRQSAEIVFSDVVAAHVAAANAFTFAVVHPVGG